MVLAQKKYYAPDPGLNGEEATDFSVRKSKNRSRKRRPSPKLSFSVQCCLASAVVGLVFLAGIALTLYYILPTRLGYQVVNLEREIHQLEQQQKLLEVEEAHARSLGRIETIATTQMAMLPMLNQEAAVALVHVESKATANSQLAGSNDGINRVASGNGSQLAVPGSSEAIAAVASADSSLDPAADRPESIIQATARLVSGKFITASRGGKAVPAPVDD